MFDLLQGPYSDIFVFDRHAITIKDSNVINAVFFDKYRGETVPANLERPLHEPWKDSTYEKFAVWDYKGTESYKVLAMVRTSGSLALYSYTVDVKLNDLDGSMTKNSAQSNFFLTSTEITVF